MTHLLQLASAFSADLWLHFFGEQSSRYGIALRLDDSFYVVQPQCCGWNANLALLATAISLSLICVRRPWLRVALVLLSVPLGILRNGLHIATIVFLCRHVGPQMIDSSIHTHGGPLFFFLALIPLGLACGCVMIWEGKAFLAHATVDTVSQAVTEGRSLSQSVAERKDSQGNRKHRHSANHNALKD